MLKPWVRAQAAQECLLDDVFSVVANKARRVAQQLVAVIFDESPERRQIRGGHHTGLTDERRAM